MNTAEVIVFDNLIAMGGPSGTHAKVEAIKPQSFVCSNASGGVRSVSNFEEVGSIASETASNFTKVFSRNTK